MKIELTSQKREGFAIVSPSRGKQMLKMRWRIKVVAVQFCSINPAGIDKLGAARAQISYR